MVIISSRILLELFLLLDLRKEDTQHITLLERIDKHPSEIETPHVEEGDDWEEEVHQASILIQSILRGRASQMLVCVKLFDSVIKTATNKTNMFM